MTMRGSLSAQLALPLVAACFVGAACEVDSGGGAVVSPAAAPGAREPGPPVHELGERDGGVTPPTVDAGSDGPDGSAGREGRFVAVGYDGRRAVSLDGRTWTNDRSDGSGNVDGPQLFRDISHAQGLFVAVGGGCEGGCRGRIATTRDGITWREVAPTEANNWLGGVAFGNGRWVTVGGWNAFTSVDGETWQLARVFDRYRRVRFGNGWFVAVGDEGRRARSRDGITWVDETRGGVGLSGLAYGNGVWVAHSHTGRRVRSIDDGATWRDDGELDALNGTDSILFAEGRFLAAGEGKTATSTDGASWVSRDGLAASGIAFGTPRGQARYLGFAWVAARRTSDDGVTWRVALADDRTSAFTSAVYGE